MRANVAVYSKVFLADADESWSARPTAVLMRRLHNELDSARMICRFDCADSLEANYISIGDPVLSHGAQREILYLPAWFIETLGLEDGSVVSVEFKRSETLQKAKSLSFKVIGDIPDGLDIRDLIEEPLSQLGVLTVGQMIPVPALEGTLLLLESCEPDGTVFLDGADIALDIVAESLTPAPTHMPVPVPTPGAKEEIDFDAPMVSVPQPLATTYPFQGRGYRLGT